MPRLSALLPLSALLLVAQSGGRSVEDARKVLLGAPDAATRAGAAEALGRANVPSAVDALLDGLRSVEGRIAQLQPEKGKVLEEIDKFDIGKKMRPAPASGGGAKGAAGGGGAKGAAAGGLVIDAGQYDKWQALLLRAREIEEKIMAEEIVRRAVVEALGAATDSAAVSRMIREAKGSAAAWSVRAALCEGLGLVPADGVTEALADRLVKDADARVRLAAAVALGLRTPAPVDVLQSGMQDKDWRVRAETIRAIGASKSKDAVAPLIEAMEREEGRLRGDAREALKACTGLDKGDDPKGWKAWWVAQAAGSPAAAAVTPSGDTLVKYYGIPVTSKRLVFLLDHSGSMQEPAAWQGVVTEATPLSGSPKDGLPPLPARPPGGRKWDVAVWELSRVLYRLPPDAAFNVICFDHEYISWQPRLQRASPAAKRSALEFLQGVQPAGLTNLFDPLERAFTMGVGPGVVPAKTSVDDVDTIYIVTDGIPNLGQVPEPLRILQKVMEMNRYRRIAIHTVWIGIKPGIVRAPPDPAAPPPPDPEKEREVGEAFLKLLAQVSGGTFVSRSGETKVSQAMREAAEAARQGEAGKAAPGPSAGSGPGAAPVAGPDASSDAAAKAGAPGASPNAAADGIEEKVYYILTAYDLLDNDVSVMRSPTAKEVLLRIVSGDVKPRSKRIASAPAYATVAPRAVAWLGAAEWDDVTEAFVKIAKDPEHPARREAIEALGKSGDESTVDLLLFFARESNPVVAVTALQALGDKASPKARGAVSGLLADADAGNLAETLKPVGKRIAQECRATLGKIDVASAPDCAERFVEVVRDNPQPAAVLWALRLIERRALKECLPGLSACVEPEKAKERGEEKSLLIKKAIYRLGGKLPDADVRALREKYWIR